MLEELTLITSVTQPPPLCQFAFCMADSRIRGDYKLHSSSLVSSSFKSPIHLP
jgi:hypothetical protein